MTSVFKTRDILVVFAVVAMVFGSVLTVMSSSASAVDVFQSCSGTAAQSGSAVCNNQANSKLFGAGSIWNNILNTLIYVIGIISVLMIIIGGLRYTISGGDSGSITSAKNTILYSVVGLVIAALSFAIVNFVLARL